jgi:hypothetical protein
LPVLRKGFARPRVVIIPTNTPPSGTRPSRREPIPACTGSQASTCTTACTGYPTTCSREGRRRI